MPLPTDPLLNQQWHLGNPIAGLLDLNVRGVWNPSEGLAYTGAGTRTVVIDNGFDYNHQDFDNYDQSLDFDFEFNTLDPFGAASESHGTAVAGIIGAAADGTGAVGVAYGTSLVGYRTANLISDAWLQDVRDAISNAATNAQADVANISQGIANDLASEFGIGYNAVRFDEIETSIGTAVNTGRGGLGMTIVKSAGNSRAGDYDVNADDWTNDTRQVVVGAVDQDGFVSSYSSYGAALLVSAFGTPGEVLTTDRTGGAGYDATDFTSTFNGTSAAAPMVSGVVSLMYDANSGLGWRDVQSILANSARQVGSEVGAGTAGSERYAWSWNASNTWNGGGMHFSNDYGYGLVDTLAAVRLAETWLLAPGTNSATTTSNEFSNSIDMLNSATVIPDGNLTGTTFSGNATFDDTVERVTVQITFSTTYTADMEVYLISPDGTVSELIRDNGGGSDFTGTWTFESQAFRGERAAGQWQVRIVDDAGGDTLTVSDIVVRTYGSATSNDRYVFTNEYSDYDGVGGHTTNVVDANGGIDVVNAAAVTSGSIIHLGGGGSNIDGVNLTFINLEHAIGGDGSDTLIGDSGANYLNGGRGNDTIDGGVGIDTMIGGTGNDIYYVDNAADVLTEAFNAGVDAVRTYISWTLGANFERLGLLGVANINATGNALANVIGGNNGNNQINGGAGDDFMAGFLGNDIYYVTSAGDVTSEQLNEGTDIVRSYITRTLGNNLERLELYGAGNINGTGNALDNALVGNSAVNILNGAAGNDVIRGGIGGDVLTGGTGLDAFQYTAANQGGDIITDFRNIAGDNDHFRFSAVGFGGGLVAGALNPLFFQSRADNLAQDANDRFIFRTTDQTLWFDVNGNGAGGLTLIADLQAGAVVTAADILIF